MTGKKTQLRLTNADVRTLKAGLLQAGTGEKKDSSSDTLGSGFLSSLEQETRAATMAWYGVAS